MESVVEKTKDISFDFNTNIPEKYQQEIKKACYLLKNEGVQNVYLFGSMVTGGIHAQSDIDIGIRGIPKGKFFDIYAKLYWGSNIEFDLIDFDFNSRLYNLLDSINEVVEIG